MSNTPRIKTPKLDAIQGSVPDSLIEVQLGDRPVKVKSLLDWPADALDDMQTGSYKAWFEGVVDGGAELWAAQTPTLREVLSMIEQLDVEKLTAGLSLGK